MSDLAAIKATVYGRVQGVFFRVSTRRRADELGLEGDVRNLHELSGVEVHAEGEKEQLEKLVEFLKTGPPGAKVEKIEVYWSDYTGDYTDFRIKY